MRRERSQSSDRGRKVPGTFRKASCSKVGQIEGLASRVELTVVCMVFLTVLQEGETLLCRKDHV